MLSRKLPTYTCSMLTALTHLHSKSVNPLIIIPKLTLFSKVTKIAWYLKASCMLSRKQPRYTCSMLTALVPHLHLTSQFIPHLAQILCGELISVLSKMANFDKGSKYSGWKLPQLKVELKKRNARMSGRKHELVKRLDDLDRINCAFGHDDLEPEDYTMDMPDDKSYRDINSSRKIVSVSMDEVTSFLDLYDQTLEGSSAVSMYESKFLMSIRFSIVGDLTFIRGRVSAQLKKKTFYQTDIIFDEHGVVTETQCECSVGEGPEAHCKHVSLTIYAVTHKDTGIITKETCTQTLQTFHQAKRYNGSPVKTEDLKLRKNGKIHDLKNFDPRPAEHVKDPQYPYMFKNVVLNSRQENWPIRQIYPPANIRAIDSDHDYLERPQHHYFLRDLGVRGLSVQQHVSLEKNTRKQSRSKKWKNERCKRIHSSNFGRICKATEKTNFDTLANSLQVAKDISSKPTNHGKKYEKTAIKHYTNTTGNKVIKSGIRVSSDFPFLGCSPDGLVGNAGIIEVKCPYTAHVKKRNVTPKSVPYLKKEVGNHLSLKRDHPYYYQIQGTLLCTDRLWCDLVVWTGKDCKIVPVLRDDGFINDMVTKLKNFYNEHFEPALVKRFYYKNTDEYNFKYK